MKKFVMIICCVVFGHLSISNPIIYPLFSEIYFEGDNWTIELCDLEFSISGTNLDNVRIVSSNGSSMFMPGIDIEGLYNLLVTNEDLLWPLYINKQNGFIVIEENVGSWYAVMEPVYFGYHENSPVNPTYEGQSLLKTFVYYESSTFEYTYWLVKDNLPSLGTSFFQAQTKGTFSGFVFDKNGHPIQNMQIKYCPDELLGYAFTPLYTIADGSFLMEEIFGRNYDISLIWNEASIYDTMITIEPDSTTYCEFNLDTTLVNIQKNSIKNHISFQNYPNPCKESTTFVVQLAEKNRYSEIWLKVYDLNGRMVYSFEFKEPVSEQYKLFHNWNLSNYHLTSGEYVGILEAEGKILADTKTLVIN